MRGLRWVVPLGLLALGIGLGGQLYRSLTHQEAAASAAAPAAPDRDVAGPGESVLRVERPSRETFNELDQRPLFTSTRRPRPAAPPPRVAAPAPVVRPAPPPSGLELLGTILGPLGHPALVRSPRSDESLVVGPGSSVGEWSVVGVEADRLFLRSGQASEEVQLRRDRSGPPDEMESDWAVGAVMEPAPIPGLLDDDDLAEWQDWTEADDEDW